ncbi:MAG: signal peptidase I [Elusimicrobiota bacterium]
MSLRRLLFLFAIAAVAAGALRLVAFEGIYIASASMEPALPVGTHVLLDKITFRFREPRRGEIIAFSAPVPPHEEMVKRVIAAGGDVVELRRKEVFVDGALVEEPYARHTRPRERLRGDTMGPVEVPELHYFVLGDNRDESNDSTVWRDSDSGEPVRFVPRSRVRGILRGFY